MESNNGEAKIQKVKNWSPVWIFPIVTALIGAWVLFYHYSHQGPEVTLITANAEGIEGGKTTIKSRSVDVGVVESATLADDLTHVEIKARLISFMEKLFDFPSNDFATSIPFLKPVFYDLTVIIFWTPTFSINYIFCKNIINT